MTMVWFLDEEGKLSASRVRTGISDGRQTQIEGRFLEEGMNLISGADLSAESGSNTPFQSGQQQRRPPGGF